MQPVRWPLIDGRLEGGRRWAASAAGQLVGVCLLASPAVLAPLSAGGAGGLALDLLAAVAGFLGSLLIVTGLAVRWGWVGPQGRSPLRHDRSVWLGAVTLAVLGCAAALGWSARAISDGWQVHLPAAVTFGLPGIALAVLAWRHRAEPAAPR